MSVVARELSPARPKFRRRRSLLAYVVLGQLLYGRHTSVRWTSARGGVIRATPFAKTLSIDSTDLRSYCDWLYRNKFLTLLEHRYGEVIFELALLPVRETSDGEG